MKQWRDLRLAYARHACKLPSQAKMLECALPADSAAIATLQMIALDLETTGLDVKRNRILAAGWVLLRGDRIVISSAKEVQARDESAEGVGQSAVIHGILDSDLVEAGTLETLLDQLLPELAGRPIIAHAATIERGFLNALLRQLGGTALPNPFIDTLLLERTLIESRGGTINEMQGQLTLEACRARHGLSEHQRHSAAADALATAELFLAQVAELGGADKLRLRDVR